MDIRRVRFAYLAGAPAIDVLPADPKANRIFAAALMAHVQPYALAARLGRLAEGTAERSLALAYAEGVVIGSPTSELQMDRHGWVSWLLAHPREFAILRSIAEDPEQWKGPSREVFIDPGDPALGVVAEEAPSCPSASSS